MSTAKIDKLVRMANQIGDFFAPMGEDAATRGVATHLKRSFAWPGPSCSTAT